MKRYIVVIAVVIALLATGCFQPGPASSPAPVTSSSSASTPTPAQTLSRLEISPAQAKLIVGETAQFTVTGRDASGGAVVLTGVNWSVSNDIGSIDSSGLFSARKAGDCKVRVSAGSGQFSAEASITVAEKVLELSKIEISPPSASITVEDTIQFTAQGRDADGGVVALVSPVWTVTNSIGTVENGIFTATKAGSGTVAVEEKGKKAEAVVRVKERQIPLPTPTVAVTPTVASFTTPQFKFKLTYPADWTLEVNEQDSSLKFVAPDEQSIIYQSEGTVEGAYSPKEIADQLLENWEIAASDRKEEQDFNAKGGLLGYYVRFDQMLRGQAGEGFLYVYIKNSGANTDWVWFDGDGRGEAGIKQVEPVLMEMMLIPNRLDPKDEVIPSPQPPPPETKTFKFGNYKLPYPADWTVDLLDPEIVQFNSPDTRMYITVAEGTSDQYPDGQSVAWDFLENVWGIGADQVTGENSYTAKNGWPASILTFDETIDGLPWQAAMVVFTKEQTGGLYYLMFAIEAVQGSSFDDAMDTTYEMIAANSLQPQ